MRGHEKTCKETERGKGECEEVKTQSYDVNRKKVYVPLCADVRVGHASLRGRLIPLRFLPSHPALSFAGRPSGSPPWVACTPPSSASTAHAPPSPPPTTSFPSPSSFPSTSSSSSPSPPSSTPFKRFVVGPSQSTHTAHTLEAKRKQNEKNRTEQNKNQKEKNNIRRRA